MTMPETTVDENDLLSSYEHQIGRSGQIAAMQPIPEAHPVHQSSHDHLGFRVLSPDTGHPFGSLVPGKRVDHGH